MRIKTAEQQTIIQQYSNMVIGTLAVDGRAVTFGTARRGLGCYIWYSEGGLGALIYSTWHYTLCPKKPPLFIFWNNLIKKIKRFE